MSAAWAVAGCLSWLLIGLFIGGLAVFGWVCWMDGRRDREWKAEFYAPIVAEDRDPVSVGDSGAAA